MQEAEDQRSNIWKIYSYVNFVIARCKDANILITGQRFGTNSGNKVLVEEDDFALEAHAHILRSLLEV